MKTWFLSFADRRFKSIDLIRKEAVNLGFFDNIITGDQQLFEKWYRLKYKERFKDRGYGYWQWKSYLIRRIMDRMDEGDVLLYADAGCKLNTDGKERLVEYFDIVKQSSSGILLFDQHYPEAEYTKGDVFKYFGVSNDVAYTQHGQVAGGIVMICKGYVSQQFINELYYICHNHYELITDSPSIALNFPEFKEHRHDQSIISLLAVKYDATELPIEEVYTDGNWETEMKSKPIWACRRRSIRFTHKCRLAYENYVLRRKE